MTLDPSEEAELDARIDAALEKLRKHAETAETKAREAIARACEKAQAEYLAARDAREAAKLAAHGPFWWQDNEP